MKVSSQERECPVRLSPGTCGCRGTTWFRSCIFFRSSTSTSRAMLNDVGIDRVYLACGSTDLRKSSAARIDGLAVLVKEGFELDPFSSCLFVFCNRQRDKLKILQWQHNGFWLYYRRYEYLG